MSNLDLPRGKVVWVVVLNEIDRIVEKKIIRIESEKSGGLQNDLGGAPVKESLPETEAAIGKVRDTFGNSGISIAFCGEDHSYQHPEPELKVPEPSDWEKQWEKWYNEGELGEHDAQDYLRKKGQREKETEKAKSDFKILHKSWEQSVQDQSRAETLHNYVNGNNIAADLVVLERGMGYLKVKNEIREETILEMGFRIRQRSALVAAYIFLCVAGGDQTGNDRILVFFGDEHQDILECFEHYVNDSVEIPWVRKRKRNYCHIPSHVP